MKKPLALICLFVLLTAACAKKDKPDHSQATPVVTTFAGSGSYGSIDGIGAQASFENPVDVALDANGNLYVTDFFDNKIRKITPDGMVTTFAGSGTEGANNGAGSLASFNEPSGIATDAIGNVYVTDQGNNLIRKISPDGIVTTLAGNGAQGSADGMGTSASFNIPFGIAVDLAGNVYVADYGNSSIRKITPAGIVTTLAGSGVQGSDNGMGTSASFNNPLGIAVDRAGYVYVVDNGNSLIRKISPSGLVTTIAGNGSRGSVNGIGTSASFNFPVGIAVDLSGNLYVADADNNQIRKITPDGMVSTIAGSGRQGAANGAGSLASFNFPQGVVADAAGNIYVADSTNNLIRKIKI